MKLIILFLTLSIAINVHAKSRAKINPSQAVSSTHIQLDDVIELELEELSADNNDEYFDFQKEAQEFDLYVTLEVCVDNDSGVNSEDVCSTPLITTEKYKVESFREYNGGWRTYHPKTSKKRISISGRKLNLEAQKLLKRYPESFVKYHLHLYSDHMWIIGGDKIRASKTIFGYYGGFEGVHEIEGDDAAAKVKISLKH